MGNSVVVNPPACVDRENHRFWKSSARRSGGGGTGSTNNRAGFCIDCLPDFKRKHMAAGTCSNPVIRFHVDDDGFAEGYLPGKVELDKRPSLVGDMACTR